MKVGSITKTITSYSPIIFDNWSLNQKPVGTLDRDIITLVVDVLVDSYSGKKEIIVKVLNGENIGWMKSKFLKEV